MKFLCLSILVALIMFACNFGFRLNIEKTIANAESIREAESKFYDENGRYTDLNGLISAGLIERDLQDGKDAGFIFELTANTHGYKLIVFPDLDVGVVNKEDNEQLSLYLDESAIIRVSLDPLERANSLSPPLNPKR